MQAVNLLMKENSFSYETIIKDDIKTENVDEFSL